MGIKLFYKRIWQKWLKVGKIIGHYNTKLLLGFTFYTVFIVYRLIAKMLKKDILDLKISEYVTSYWKMKEKIEMQHYKQY